MTLLRQAAVAPPGYRRAIGNLGDIEEGGIAYQYQDGSTPKGQRTKSIDAFQSGLGEVFHQSESRRSRFEPDGRGLSDPQGPLVEPHCRGSSAGSRGGRRRL